MLRFNFSEGLDSARENNDYGNGEVEDVRTALDWMDAEFHPPLLFAGFSSDRTAAGCVSRRVKGLIGVGVPAIPVAADRGRAAYLQTFGILQDCFRSAAHAIRLVRARSWRLCSHGAAGAEEACSD